ncbi:hypothetical protein ScPMuIL_012543 [Solemya velum]
MEKSQEGGAKKFLYTGPNKNRQKPDEDQWTFTPRQAPTSCKKQTETKNDLDNIWSLKHIQVGPGLKSNGDFINNKSSYSRYGGMKEKEEFSSSFGSHSNGNSSSQEQTGRTWNMTRPGFSYSQNNKPSSSAEKSPRDRNQSRNNTNSRFGGSGWNFGYKPPW